LEARALESLNRISSAIEVVEEGLTSALEAEKYTEALNLCIIGARLTLQEKGVGEFERFLTQGMELAASEGDIAAQLKLGKLRLEHQKEVESNTAEKRATSDLIRIFRQTPRKVLEDENELATDILNEIGVDNPSVLEHAINTLRPVDPGPIGQEGLAKLLSAASQSGDFQQRKKDLFRELGMSGETTSWQKVAKQAVNYGGLDKALRNVVRYGALDAAGLQSVVKILMP
jgi:hypothetical protein